LDLSSDAAEPREQEKPDKLFCFWWEPCKISRASSPRIFLQLPCVPSDHFCKSWHFIQLAFFLHFFSLRD
jgi:hypothetical protein